MHQRTRIQGKSRTSNGNLFYATKNTSSQTLPGGLFSEPTNQGSHHQNAFSTLLETGAKLSYQFSHSFGITLGYDFLWFNQALRPGKQIDRKLNPTRTALAEASRTSLGIGPDKPVPFGTSIPAPLPNGPKRPKFKPRSSDFWAQGLVFGLGFRF